FPSAELIGEIEQQRGRGSAVVGDEVSGFAQGIIRVVVAGYNDDPIARARKFGDDVPHRKLAFPTSGGESIILDQVAFEVRVNVIFHLLVIAAADGPRAKGDHLTHVLHGASGLEGGGSRLR